ncbi:DUF2726 domain-containing protein [Shewanella sp. CG12_big_fil_rev_8_21_14_0_65_47_15]|uniref:DUF2726 domain-containing protein n=1 Tax=Shewanella sp. CG12_big_fil_rev_8_21_14_0_65_47_15 TaxID=1975537 RepID=UPI0025D4110A|nr:DUF2726 domain-containing protein [Shewanella sp. CG12_big_fil_rev_8_21_14_0_65_47_15]
MNSNQLILIGLGLAIIIFVPLLLRIFTNLLIPTSDNNYRYRKQDALFSNTERSFLGILDQAVGEQFRILGKVRIADVITPEKGMNRKHWQIAFNRISAKHFDYSRIQLRSATRTHLKLSPQLNSTIKAISKHVLSNATSSSSKPAKAPNCH